MKRKLTPFDLAGVLDSEEAINEYLAQVQADADIAEHLRAIAFIAQARETLTQAKRTQNPANRRFPSN
ncbi:hypothetical protein N4P55_07765 [Pseudomonas fluorescens]|uniref:hypothetical protein n=1 Tax=Pseudomonas fluorescens TaxID=294 RepID=UPI0021CEC853|nr:hypothetical protein [Pseudomonas fluorescens]UXV21238.1 hypothetical protein N4P55_07765 [Pseudomonas fluorescens]